MKQLLRLLLGGRSAFDRSFRLNEYAAIARRGAGKTLLWLSLIVGVTLAALGFGVGSLEQLRVRMDNPFTNIVDLGIYSGYQQDFQDARKELLQEGESLGLDTITQWSRYNLSILPAKNKLGADEDAFVPVSGRTVDYTSALFNAVFTAENVIYGLNFHQGDREAANLFDAGGLIWRASTLTELGYKKNEFEQLRALPVYSNSLDGVYFLPVLAIVNDLPSNAGFVSSFDLYASIYGPDCAQRSFIINKDGDNSLEFVVPERNAEDFVTRLGEILNDPEAGLDVETAKIPGERARTLRKVSLYVDLPFVRDQPEFYRSLIRELEADRERLDWIEYVRYSRQNCSPPGVQHASFLFHELNGIKPFRKVLMEKTGIELPTEVAEKAENFALVSDLGKYIGLILLVFAVASICFFIRNLIEGHLNEVKPNLGTFKAFGLPDGILISHYRRIILVLLLLAVTFGVLAAFLFGWLISAMIGEGFYDLINMPIALAVTLIFLFSIFYSGIVIRKILSKSPGDLVYGRS